MIALLIFIVLFGAVLAFWFAVKRDRKSNPKPRRWLVSNTQHGKVYADPWVTPPLLRLRTVHDEARRHWQVPETVPDIFHEIRWYVVPNEFCKNHGATEKPDYRFPVPWRGGTIYTTGWTVVSERKTAVSATADDATFLKEFGNQYRVYKEDDPLP